LSSTFHRISPGVLSLEARNNLSLSDSIELNKSRGLENALYLEVNKKISSTLSLLAGVRFSFFYNIGPGTQFLYDESFTNIGTIARRKAEFYHTFARAEPRLSTSYQFNEQSSLKGSYNRTVQYISQATNSLIGSPLDVWFLASPNVKPQTSDQLSIGYFRQLSSNRFDLSIEAFHRKVKNEIDFKDNASLLLNEELEGELRVGTATAYGLELSFSKNEGKLIGQVNFTWSKSILDIPLVNRGQKYPSSYDRPFNLSISPSYVVNDRKRINANWMFFNGLPFTSPTGRFSFGNLVVPSFSSRNGDRLPNYHRLDIGYEIEGKNKKNRRFTGAWAFAVVNVYNRKNANFISFRTIKGTNQSEAVKFTIFSIIPSVSYRFRF
ncbi:MAG: TonB-dependent receptor, partial [Bacteroidota bacterium]